MAVSADAAMREVRLGALLANPAENVLRRRAGDRLAADQRHRRVVDEADRLERGHGVVAQIAEQARRRQQRHVIDQDGRAVGRRARDALVRDRAAGAGDILDDDALPQRASHMRGDQARHDIGAAAGRVRIDDRDRARRRLRRRLPPGCQRDHRQADPCQPQSNKAPARAINHHSLLPMLSSRRRINCDARRFSRNAFRGERWHRRA